jgi:hypothetical protein
MEAKTIVFVTVLPAGEGTWKPPGIVKTKWLLPKIAHGRSETQT